MKIHKAKASDYNTVNTESIIDYMQVYARAILHGATDDDKIDRLAEANRTQLKEIAAELETVNKRLNYILEGRY